jgi:hypothetical protein
MQNYLKTLYSHFQPSCHFKVFKNSGSGLAVNQGCRPVSTMWSFACLKLVLHMCGFDGVRLGGWVHGKQGGGVGPSTMQDRTVDRMMLERKKICIRVSNAATPSKGFCIWKPTCKLLYSAQYCFNTAY